MLFSYVIYQGCPASVEWKLSCYKQLKLYRFSVLPNRSRNSGTDSHLKNIIFISRKDAVLDRFMSAVSGKYFQSIIWEIGHIVKSGKFGVV